MQMFPSRNKTEWIPLKRAYRYTDPQLEQLGRRIDAVRTAITQSKSEWGHRYWSQLEAVLIRKWKYLISREDLAVVDTDPPQTEIDYSWWEPACEPGLALPMFGRMEQWAMEKFSSTRIQEGLARSWERARNELIQKARQGLA